MSKYTKSQTADRNKERLTTIGKLAWKTKISRDQLLELIQSGKVEAPKYRNYSLRYEKDGLKRATEQIERLKLAAS